MVEDWNLGVHRMSIVWFALVEMAAGYLESSGGTRCLAQDSQEAARGFGYDDSGVVGQGRLAVCQFLGVWGHLGQALVQLRNCLTFKMPSTLQTTDTTGPACGPCAAAKGGCPPLT